MIYHEVCGETLSLLGFGGMRLPVLEQNAATIDEEQTAEMVRLAMEAGVNYFDTAYPYHGGQSERVLGRILGRYPRERYYLATKYPGHQISPTYDPAAIFEEQLQKCGVEYFDFYLLHNVYENSIQTYSDPRWGIIDYFVEQKRLGRIRHLGFSTHGGIDVLREFLDRYGEHMEFCQIQLNYVDWTLQNGKEKYQLLTQRGIPVWVMEPVRGGKLAALPEEKQALLYAARPGQSVASWAFRWLQGLENVKMILSGMSSTEQVRDNLNTFACRNPLSGQEMDMLMTMAEELKNAIPCTACRYCCDGCPKGLAIPALLEMLNELRFAPAINIAMRVEALPADQQPSACIGCGKCTGICPQKIDIPGAMKDFAARLEKLPSWAEICRQREEAAKKNSAD